MKEYKKNEEGIWLFNVFVSLFTFSHAGPMSFTLESEVPNGVMKFTWKKKKKRKIDYIFILNSK